MQFLQNIEATIREHQAVTQQLSETLLPTIDAVAQLLITTIQNNKKIFWCGNGGSAADAEHLAAELVGRFKDERRALKSYALTTNTSALTAIANDYGFDNLFARQLEGLIEQDDVLIGITTSGNSANIINAIATAKAKGAKVVTLLGRDGGKLKSVGDHEVLVAADDTARVQEMHIMIGHIWCECIDAVLLKSQG